MSEVGALLGRVVAGKFKIEEHVGSGAMGEVFRARHVILDTVVALKIMRSDIAKDAMFKERFYREAKAASRLEHPNSVRVIDFGVEPDGLVYLAMEFLHGRDLLSVLREEWPLPDDRIVDILVQTLSAVAVAHQLGIVHRDLKPENIMVSVGAEEDGAQQYQVKVCDFGIAKLNDPRGFQTDGGKALTTSGTLIGTPEYMSPEQSRGDPLDARSDLYSLGIILYQLLVGRVPFAAENALGVVLKQVTDAPVPPSKVRPGVNPRLEAICMRALLKPREERYQTAKDMRRDLRGVFGYRASGAIEESGRHLAARAGPTSDPDISGAATLILADVATAPTEQMPASDTQPDFAAKQTSDGTELTVGTPPKRRRLGALIAVAALATGALIASVIFFRTRVDTPKEKATANATASTTASAGPVAVGSTSPPESESLPPLAGSSAPSVVSPVAGKHGVVTSGKHVAAPSTKGATAAVAPGGAPPPASAGGASSAAAPPTAGGAAYNPAGAHVSLGHLTCMRVKDDVIARKMSEILPRLSECYRNELMMLGAPVGGSAEIHLSIDDKGNVTPFVNSAKHPGFQRCAASTLVGQRVPVSALVGDTSQGATVTQSLSLQP